MNITICDRCGEKANGEFESLRIVDIRANTVDDPVDICAACARGFKAWWERAKAQPDFGAWRIGELPRVGGTDA